MTVMVSSTTAQSAMNPPGSVRGLFGGEGPPNPGRTSQQVSAWFDLSGGYDQNSDGATATGGTSLDGYASTALGGFRYWRGKTTRSLEATSSFYRNTQGNGSTTTTGGEVNVRGNVEIGRRAGITAALRGANDSAVLFGAFGPSFQERARGGR